MHEGREIQPPRRQERQGGNDTFEHELSDMDDWARAHLQPSFPRRVWLPPASPIGSCTSYPMTPHRHTINLLGVLGVLAVHPLRRPLSLGRCSDIPFQHSPSQYPSAPSAISAGFLPIRNRRPFFVAQWGVQTVLIKPSLSTAATHPDDQSRPTFAHSPCFTTKGTIQVRPNHGQMDPRSASPLVIKGRMDIFITLHRNGSFEGRTNRWYWFFHGTVRSRFTGGFNSNEMEDEHGAFPSCFLGSSKQNR